MAGALSRGPPTSAMDLSAFGIRAASAIACDQIPGARQREPGAQIRWPELEYEHGLHPWGHGTHGCLGLPFAGSSAQREEGLGLAGLDAAQRTQPTGRQAGTPLSGRNSFLEHHPRSAINMLIARRMC
jgi:hypothetical protein